MPAEISAVPPIEFYEAKSQIEDRIASRFRTQIATMLEKDSFDVSAQVLLKEKAATPAGADPKKIDPQKLDSRLEYRELGIMDSDEVVDHYEAEIARLKSSNAPGNAQPALFAKYEVKSVRLLVGVSPDIEGKNLNGSIGFAEFAPPARRRSARSATSPRETAALT